MCWLFMLNYFLCVTYLFVMSNYLFLLWIKLFGDIDSFVRDIYFPLFILYNLAV